MKTERLHLRLDPEFVARLDTWRGRQLNPPTRSGALRELADRAMAADGLEGRQIDWSRPELQELLSQANNILDVMEWRK